MARTLVSSTTSVDQQVSQYLTKGSDDRLHLNKLGLNKYQVAPYVESSSTIQRAYCTCSPPSPVCLHRGQGQTDVLDLM